MTATFAGIPDALFANADTTQLEIFHYN